MNNLKRISCVFAALMLSLTITSQIIWDNSKPDEWINYGVRGGLNWSTIVPDGGPGGDYPKFYKKQQYHAGVVVDVNLSNSLAIETGLTYSMKGADMDSTSTWSGYEVYMNYLQIPLLAKAKLYLNPSINIQFKVGPYLGIKLNDPDEALGGRRVEMQKLDYGIVFGGGVSVYGIYVGVQYEKGMKSFWDYNNRKHSNLAISLGYDFKLRWL